MQDKVVSVVNPFNLTDSLTDRNIVEPLKDFLTTGTTRVQVVAIVSSKSAEIIKQAISQLFQEQPELVQPGGNAYTTRRYNMYVRDMGYFLRYCTYALLTGENSVLDERLLAGLKETFNSLGIPLGPTARSVQLMRDGVKQQVQSAGIESATFIDEPFDYVVRQISEMDV
ncbi:allophycocyanin subunit beta [Phormidesmis sp. 146-12]